VTIIFTLLLWQLWHSGDSLLSQDLGKTGDGAYRHDSTSAGDYALCLDNGYSAISDKTIYVEISVEDPVKEDANYYYDDYIDYDDLKTMRERDQVENLHCTLISPLLFY